MSATELKFIAIPSAGREVGEVIASLALNRPDAANSFNADVMRELRVHIDTVAHMPECRALVLRGYGKHFSAGADLAWMQSAAQLSYDENIKDAELLTHLFEALTELPIPTIALVNGAAYGGAVGLIAACDFAIADQKARFCLSEVKLGLLPAVIMPYLARKMRPGQLRRQALSGRVFSADEALNYGLVEIVADEADFDRVLREELEALLQAAPEAQAAVKKLQAQVVADRLQQGPHTSTAIAKARTGASGQAGLSAFFAKAAAPWVRHLGDQWSLNDQ